MNDKLTVVRLFCAGFSGIVSVGGVPYESRLFRRAHLGEDKSLSNLGGESRVSQGREFLDHLFCRFADFNGGSGDDGGVWERSDISHLNELLRPDSGFSLIGLHDSVSITTPLACDGRFHVSYWTSGLGVRVVPLHKVLLSKTVFLLVRRIVQ